MKNNIEILFPVLYNRCVAGIQLYYVVQIKNFISKISSQAAKLLHWDTYLPPFSMKPLFKNSQ